MNTRILFLTSISLALIGSSVGAAPRTSAAYSVPCEAADAGGLRATSAAYVNDGSVGGIGGIGTTPAPVQTAKHGYVGQLFDLIGLRLAADPTNVNEGDPRQLTASAAADDGSVLALAGSSVNWSVESGPLVSVSPGGLATADIVYQNTAATVQGRYQALSALLGLLVVDINPDNFGMYAGDGLPDSWQVNHFGLNNPAAFPGADPDLDGQTNGFEYVTGTLPLDGTSYFRFRIDPVAGQPTHRNLVFSPRYPSRTYSMFFHTRLDGSPFVPLAGTSTSDNGPERTVTDLNATNDLRFYRVHISLP